ncbi:Y-family DNA polymerase [Alginatibacterium sediminis]|uniref:Y-family DNA polymerase n=1 Tax=Alginatibacterium sediminis TaxID=2164068 RepID=A0A420EGX2_9ALTE|nr:Y-family DNA polymerase [Alginatibacterium sediminis]RKF19962.1 Y-family DNA polymerase [Alginatibacterium sediminis]
MFALVDVNSMYCACEQVFDPSIRGKPVVVLSNNDGCIVAANRQAKVLGIPKFKPFFEVKALCEKHKVVVKSSNYELYSSLSNKLMDVIGRFAPEQHVYSIDESFLSFKHCAAIPDLHAQAMSIRRAAWKETRLAVCVGIGNTLTLAKVANHAAKKHANYHGVCVIESVQQRTEILKAMDVSEVWGIGRQLSKRLKELGISTAYALSQMPAKKARRFFNVNVERTVRELNGAPCMSWDEARADKQQIFSTRSVGERITELNSLKQALSQHIAIAAAKARKQGSNCRTMMLFTASSPHDDRPKSFRRTLQFAYATNCTVTLTKAMSNIVHELFVTGVRFYRIGVGLINLEPQESSQFELFEQKQTNPALMQVLDRVNARYGRDFMFVASQGCEQKWSMRRDYLTPQYTTSWQDIPKVKC